MVDCAVQRCAAVTRQVDVFAETAVEEFDVHVVHVKKVVYHRRRALRVLEFTCGVKRHAFMRVGATGDEMVEERNVTACGDFVE